MNMAESTFEWTWNKQMSMGLKSSSFRHFKSWMMSDMQLFKLILPNCTIISGDHTNPKFNKVLGYISFEFVPANFMVFDEESLEFVTCGGGQSGYVSLFGYISAFDHWIWVWLIVVTGGSILSTLFILRTDCMTTKRRQRSFLIDCIFMPIDTILEQGNCVHDQGTRRLAVYSISCSWVLVGIVVSNAYKGQNITDLSSPVPPIKLTTFEQLVDKNFTIYSHGSNEPFVDFLVKNDQRLEQNGYIPDKYPQRNILTHLLIDADPDIDIVKQYLKIHGQVLNFTAEGILNTTRKGTLGYIEKVENCDKTAFMSWSKEIETGRLLLENILFKAGKHSMRQFISTSNQRMFRVRKGWRFEDITIPIQLTGALATVIESGIGMQWKMIEKYVQNFNLTVQVHGRSSPLLALSLNGNISVVFFVHMVLLGITFCAFALEHTHNAFWSTGRVREVSGKVPNRFK